MSATNGNRGGHFGRYLRAHRLGFRECSPLKAWMRITDEGAGFRVDLVPLETLIPRDMDKGRKREHRRWWDGDEHGEQLVALSPALLALGPVAKPLTLHLNDDGEIA